MRTKIFTLILCLGLLSNTHAAYFLTAPYLQNLKPTEVTIMWVADDAIAQMGYLYLREKGEPYRKIVATDRGMVCAYNHVNRIRLTGLQPDTDYGYYVVEKAIRNITDTSLEFTDSVVSEVYKFHTP